MISNSSEFMHFYMNFLMILILFNKNSLSLCSNILQSENILVSSIAMLNQRFQESSSFNQTFLFNFNITEKSNEMYVLNIPSDKNFTFK